MNKVQMNIWGRNFELDIYFKQYKGQEITKQQKETLEYFLKAEGLIEPSLQELVHFIESNYNDRLEEENVQNIFRYVIPKMIYVPNKSENKQIALLCNFRFEEEHGIAVVFENEMFSKIVLQDDIL